MFILLPSGHTGLISIEEDQTGQVSIQLLTGLAAVKEDTGCWAGAGLRRPTLLIMCSLCEVCIVNMWQWCDANIIYSPQPLGFFSFLVEVLAKALKQLNPPLFFWLCVSRILACQEAQLSQCSLISALRCSLELGILGCATHSEAMKWSVLWLILCGIIQLLWQHLNLVDCFWVFRGLIIYSKQSK